MEEEYQVELEEIVREGASAFRLYLEEKREQLARQLRKSARQSGGDVTADGVKVTALCPGWVDTDMASASGLDPKDMIQKDDIVATVKWLHNLSPSACVNKVMIESIKQV